MSRFAPTTFYFFTSPTTWLAEAGTSERFAVEEAIMIRHFVLSMSIYEWIVIKKVKSGWPFFVPQHYMQRMLMPKGGYAPLSDEISVGQRDEETERQRDRETERQRDRETERQRDRERDTHAHSHIHTKHIHKHMYICT
jgi:hypothetical protein